MEVLVRLCQAFYDVRTRISGPTKLQTIPVEDHVRTRKKVSPRRIPKTLLTLLGALFLFGGGASLQAQTGADFIISPANATVDVNEQFSVTVQIVSNGSSYNSAFASISFDATKLQVEGVTKAGPLDFNSPIAEQFDNTAGTISHGAGIQNSSVSTPVVDFLVIDFIATAAGVVDLEFFDLDQFSPTQIINTSFVDIMDTTTGATITIGDPPVADFTILPNPAEVNEVVQFTSTSSDTDGTIDNYEWNFGDGSPVVSGMSESAPTHTYSAPNTYTVSLTVTDNDGFTSTEMKNIVVEEVMVTLYDITASSGPGGSISPNGTVQVTDGGSQLFTFTPDPGFEVAEVLVNGNPVAVAGSYEFTNVTSAQSISVSFEAIQVCIASGNDPLTAFGREFLGDPATAPPTVPEFSRTGGQVFGPTGMPIAGTTPGSDEELLFKKELYGGKTTGTPTAPIVYTVPVPDGTYQVDLYFAEIFQDAAGARVFDVSLEDTRILDEYDMRDPDKDGIGTSFTAITRTYYVNVTGGELNVEIGPATVDNAKISGLCVTAAPGANLLPSTNIGDLTVAVGETAMESVNVSDPEMDALTVTLNGLPGSLTYNPSTGQIEGDPQIGEIGVYTINAIVDDGSSSPITEQFTLTVDPPEGDDPPTIDAPIEVLAQEGDVINQVIQVNDDFNPAASIVIYDKGVVGPNTTPFTSGAIVPAGDYSFVENPVGSGTYTLSWTTIAGDGRSYLARVTANDGTNLPVTLDITINIAEPITNTILARTFSNPLPYYSGNPNPVPGYSVTIEGGNGNIGFIDSGDFVEYVVFVPTAGPYEFTLQGAKNPAGVTTINVSENSTGSFLQIGSVGVMPNGGGWQDYADYTDDVFFPTPGVHKLRFDFLGPVNVLDFSFTPSSEPFFTAELGDQQNLEGDTPLGLGVTATDPDGGDVSYNDNGTLPPGLSIDPTTGAISGTIDVGAAANSPYAVTITATDDEMDTGTTSFNWTVLEVISTPICVNVGNQADVTAFGRSFGNDDPFVTDFQANFATTNPISGTLPGSGEEMMFQSEKNASAASGTLSYAFPTGNGAFTVELYMAEIYVGAPGGGSGLGTGDRLFDIDVEGTTETGVDLFDTYGTLQGVTKTFAVTVTDGILNIDLSAQVDRAKLSGICITPTADFVPNAAPTVEISEWTPVNDCDGDGENITLMASASDTEQGDLSSIIVWKNGLGEVVATGSSLSLTAFTGSDTYTAEVVDATPSMASESILIDVENAAPVLADVQADPAGGVEGTIVTLSATASDEEDGDITANITWTSDLDGSLGTGGSVMATLSIGVHTITASITDACGVEITEDINVEITADTAPVFVQYNNPQDGQKFRDCEGDGELIQLGVNFDDAEDDLAGTPLTIEWFNGANSLGTGNPLDVNLPIGLHSLSAVATDSKGNETPAPSSLTIEVLGEPSFTVTYDTVGGAMLAGAEVTGPGEITVCWSTTDIDLLAGEHIHLRLDGADNGQGNSSPSGGLNPYVRVDETSGCFTFTNVGLGPHTISLTGATTGHEEICDGEEFNFDVVDNVDPVAVCAPITLQLDENGMAVLDPADIDGGSTDAGGIASISASKLNFTCADIGTQQVMLIVEDNSGNTSECLADVTVVDALKPVLTCNAAVMETSLTGNPLVLEITPPTATDNCDTEVQISFVRSDGETELDAPFGIGTTNITWTATDDYGNTDSCIQAVTVNPPPNSGPVADAGPNATYTDADASGDELVTLDGSGSTDDSGIVSYSWKIGATEIATGVMPQVTLPLGMNTIELTVEDAEGETNSDQVVITISADGVDPTITCPELIAALDADANCTAELPDYTGQVTAGDDLDPNPLVTQSPVAGSLVADGDLITLTVTDATGNSASCSFNISVIDNLAPVVQNPPAMTLDLKCASEVPAAAMLTALDNCDGSLMEMPSDDLTPGATANEFTIERTWTFTDTAGNSTSFVQTINVDDDVDPEFLVCLGAQTVVGDEDGFATLANYVPQVSATDNCGGVPVLVQSPAPGTIISGANTVTITATDEAGNNMTCSFDVTVDDPTPDPLEIVEFILVDADDNVDLFTITDGMLIDVNSLPTANLNIRAVEGPTTESVVMQISGPLNKSQTESFAPYALYGDAAGNYNAQVFPLGTYNLTGTAYTGNGGTGTPGAPGNVTFTLTDVNPACVDFDAVLADSGDPTSCGGDEGFAQISVSGSDSAVSYSWSHDNSLSGSVAEGLEAGSYTVTVTNEDGCLDIVSFTLSDPAGPVVTLAPFANVLDTDATFALSGGSPAGGTYSGPGVSGGNFNPAIGPGTYPITYTYVDGNGCSGSATQNITVTSELGDAVLIVLDATTDTELFALTDGLVIYKSDIGNTPLGIIYNADLNPGGVNFNLSGPINEVRSEGPAPHSLFGDIGVNIQGKPFPVGNYTLIANAISPAGIDITVNFSIVDQDPQCIGFDAALASKANPTTCSGTDGSIMVSVSGGATPYTYSWSHNAGLDSPTASGLSAGNYSVTVTDANGCTDTVTTSISDPAAPAVTLANFAPVLESDAPFMLTGGSPAGGVYSGTGVSGGMFNPGVGPGTYTITYTYTDGTTGCSASASKNITVTSELGEAVLIVLDATTDTELFALTDGMVIFKDDIGNTPLGVIYNASLNPNGVFFNLSGPINENRSEGPAPHSLFGDIGVDIQGKPFPIGNYTLTANAISPAAPDVTVNFSVVAGSGAAREAVSKMLPMTASPTPADVEVSISFDVPTRIETFQIFDTSGKLVKTVRAAQGTNLRTYDLRVLELPSGMYYVRTKDDEGNSYQEAILISRY